MASTNEVGLPSDRVRNKLSSDLEDLHCSICRNILWKPVACQRCETPYCSACIKKWLREGRNQCPVGCQPFAERTCPPSIVKQLSRLQIACIYESNNCREILPCEALEKHETECGFQPQTCPGCHSSFAKKSIEKHKSQCPLIEITCADCKIVYNQGDATRSHTDMKCLKEQFQQFRHQRQEENKQSKEEIKRPLRASSTAIHPNATWSTNGITVIGGNRSASKTNQLYAPHGLYIDDDQTIYVADHWNHRIVQRKPGAMNGTVVAAGNGNGNGTNQLNSPRDVIVDKESGSLIISDYRNKRVVRWPRRNGTCGETIISNIACTGLTMDDNGSLYVVDWEKHEVRRYKIDDTQGTVVAGGNGAGNRLDQLSCPQYVFVDRDHSVYVSDYGNHRVMKWQQGAKQGIVVAGGQGQGSSLTQLHSPYGVVVDQLGTVYVTDHGNHRIMRWPKGATQGTVIIGGNGGGAQPNQVNGPVGLSFDRHGNLYVVEFANNRVQKFEIA
ncbi:unnamed protein product [Rotaria sp. Silwood1]|nr:unnamed protein product [Rotaria sp. Silwood1]